jgi:adenylate cyclase
MNTLLEDPVSVGPRTIRRRSIDPNSMLSVLEWLSGDECHAVDEAGLIAGLGRQLRGIGLPIDRLTLHLMTLHPEFPGRIVAWAPGEPVEIRDNEHSAGSRFASGPLRKLMGSREPMIVGMDERNWPWQEMDVYAGRGLVQLLVAPLCNVDGPVSAVILGTRRPGGFTLPDICVIERILPALRNTCELRVMRQADLSLLDTYIGPMTVQRILAGRIRQGEVETMEAALLLCSLRDFTELSNRLPGDRALELLTAYFEIVVPAITHRGGKLLKSMGDAILAFFPSSDTDAASNSAFAAVESIRDDLGHFEFDGAGIEARIALHYGGVSYGNVGSGDRPDLAFIGSDVNLLTQIQSACAVLGTSVLMSESFRRRIRADKIRTAGFHQLKGFEEPVELFTTES